MSAVAINYTKTTSKQCNYGLGMGTMAS